MVELYDKDPKWKDAKTMHNLCMLYATSYNHIVLKRLLAEQPDFLEEQGVTKGEMVAHLTNNMCMAQSKYRARMFRERTAALKED